MLIQLMQKKYHKNLDNILNVELYNNNHSNLKRVNILIYFVHYQYEKTHRMKYLLLLNNKVQK